MTARSHIQVSDVVARIQHKSTFGVHYAASVRFRRPRQIGRARLAYSTARRLTAAGFAHEVLVNKATTMARRGSETAIQHGEKLLAFPSLEEAQRHLYAFRDKHLALLSEVATQYPDFHPSYMPESLKQLEQWYFHLYETDSFQRVGLTRGIFETCMAMYFGETVVRSTTARWIVEEYPFAPGKYELGVRKDLMTMMLYRFTDHFLVPNNKRRQSLFRNYGKCFL